jgi:serpin B
MFDFTQSLLPKLAGKNTNIFFSPYSIDTAFTVVAEGASGATEEEMRAVLPSESTRYGGVDGVSSINVANAVWLQRGIEFFPEFEKAARDFKAELAYADFYSNHEGAREKVNEWTYRRTQERIKDILPPGSVSDLTKLVVANAIHFKDSWLQEFSKRMTRPEKFFTPEGPVEVMMMSDRERGTLLVEAEDYSAVILPYKNKRVDMAIILPRTEVGRGQVEMKLGEILRELSKSDLRSMQELDALQIPQFKMETNYNLNGPMQALGMRIAFSDHSQLNRISPQEPHLMIGGAFHKAFVEVNEEGTEAAAATAIAVKRSFGAFAQRRIFRADHPFLFAIRCDGDPIFVGRVVNPT